MAACGNEHTAVVSEDGRLWTWGDGSEGRLGHGDMEPCFEPQQITGNSMRGRVLLVALGGIHSAAVMEDGRLFTWGYGEDGALGQPKPYRPGFRDFNEKENRPIPTLIDPGRLGGGRIAMAACGLGFTSAVSEDGQLFTWGLGHHGVLGHNDARDRRLPAPVSSALFGGRSVEMVCCGHFHIVAVVEGGALYSWGYGGFGALGLGDKDSRATPQRVSLGSSRAVLAASGEAHSLAVAEGGSLWSWGLGERGRLGHGDEEERLTPVQVAAISAVCVSMAAAGGGHSAAVSTDGRLFTWGKGLALGLADPDRDRLLPTIVDAASLGGEGVCQVALGRNHTVAVSEGGRIFSWGLGGEGRLGLGDDEWRVTPAQVPLRPAALVGRFRRLPPSHALAFAMATHVRLGAEGCPFFGLLPELVARILEACASWPRCRAAEMPGLVRLLGGGVSEQVEE